MTGLLTGTFDPVHLGHVAIARAALEQCGLEAVWFWPNPDPAHKLSRAVMPHRLAMLELALAGEDGLQISPLTPEQLALPHTLDTFLEVMVSFRPRQFQFIVGLDTLLRLGEWRDVESVVKNTSYIVAHRSGSSLGEIDNLRMRLGKCGPDLRLRFVDLPELVTASSTAIRQELAGGEGSRQLDPAVSRYITEQRLYLP